MPTQTGTSGDDVIYGNGGDEVSLGSGNTCALDEADV